MRINQTLAERLIQRINFRGPAQGHLGRCWLWTGTLVTGYGQISYGGKLLLAHREMWLLVHKKKRAKNVLHKCDVTMCVRPSHLYSGTQIDNMRDRAERAPKQLSRKNIREIRLLLKADVPSHRVAKKFGVAEATISNIKTGKTWAWLDRRKST